MRLCCLIDSIEETGIERQISPNRSAGVKQQWHYGKGGALR
jgi:sulfur transfer protein SufE